MLTKEEARATEARGWTVCHVYDAAKQTWGLQALPTPACPIKSAATLFERIVALAKSRDEMAIRTLSVIAQDNMTRGKK